MSRGAAPGGADSTPSGPGSGAAARLRAGLAKLDIFALWRRLAAVEAALRQQQEDDRREAGARLDRVELRLDASEGRMAALEVRDDALESRCAALDDRLDGVERRLDGVECQLAAAAERAARAEARLDDLEAVGAELVREREAADQRWAGHERRLDGAEAGQRATDGEVARLRDHVLPAAAGRLDVLLARIMGEVDEVASLVERQLRHEPLPVPRPSPREDELAGALAVVQPLLVAGLRGSEAEIAHRLARHLAVLVGRGPVLDLGCGRGELLALLGEAGIEAVGVESDPALAGAARRRGLTVVEGDVLAVLAARPAASCGVVTAIHLLEHLAPDHLLAVLAEVRRVLRPGGVLLAECPDPANLRVASLFWLDPTHRRPLHADTLKLMLVASGFAVEAVDRLHPFPPEEQLAALLADDAAPADDPSSAELARRLARVVARLDDLMNGPRDFAIRATTAVPATGAGSYRA